MEVEDKITHVLLRIVAVLIAVEIVYNIFLHIK